MDIEQKSRRQFIVAGASTMAALTISFYLPTAAAKTLERLAGVAPDAKDFNAFLRIAPDDSVTVILKHLEMGQGVHTSLPMILAEELGADLSKIKVEMAPANAALYGNLFMGGIQGTGGSSSVANSWKQLLQAGATAREMLIDAAAAEMKAPRSEFRTENGKVIHSSGQSMTFGALATAASKMTPPKEVVLKKPSDYKIIGKNTSRLDNVQKTSGTAGFSMDVLREHQLVALIARPPKFGAVVKSVDKSAAMKIAGVKDVFKVPQGVAVVAENFWAAKKGRDALKISWNEDKAFKLTTDELRTTYRELMNQKGAVAKTSGDVGTAAQQSKKKISGEFEFPYLAHAPMEPLNCVIQVKDGKCDIWSGSQMPTIDQGAAAHILGMKPADVSVHTLFAGGSFGRRGTALADLVTEAASVAAVAKKNKALAGRPIHLMWTREDDIRGGFYRPFFMHKVEAGLGSNDKPSHWNHQIVGQSIMEGTPFAMMIKNGIDPTSVEGTGDMPYTIENMYVDLHSPVSPVPVLWLRSVGHTHTAFVVETMIDELAQQAGRDAVEFRLDLLKKEPRHAAVLELAAEKAGWGKSLKKGVARGIALHESFRTIVAIVAEVSQKDGVPKVERMVCAVDCGTVVNPDGVKAQIEGGIGFGLSVALHGAINFDKSGVVESNFHNYQVLRMNEMPVIEVHTISSDREPTGVGEPGVPPVAPAIANAMAQLTGQRIRRLPFKA